MEHVVFSPAPDGTPAFRRVGSLEEAVRLVEHLRNVEGVQDVSVHALTEVPLSFRAWYRVEIPTAPAASTEPVAPVEAAGDPADPVPAQAEAPREQPAPALNGATRPADLGFFA